MKKVLLISFLFLNLFSVTYAEEIPANNLINSTGAAPTSSASEVENAVIKTTQETPASSVNEAKPEINSAINQEVKNTEPGPPASDAKSISESKKIELPQKIEPVAEEKKESLFIAAAGIGLLHANWYFYDINKTVRDSYVNYKIDSSWYQNLEGSLTSPLLGISLGLNLGVDNNAVNRASKINGYLGIKNFYVRAQNGSYKGDVEWSGPIVAGQKRDIKLNQTFFAIDGLYHFESSYVGVRYTSFRSPVEIGALSRFSPASDPVGWDSAIDPNMGFKFYSLMFGFDTFSSKLLQEDKMHEGFFVLARGDDGIGYGKADMSKEGQKYIVGVNAYRTYKGSNVKTLVDSNPAFVAVHNDSTLGVQYFKNFKTFKLAVAFGYDLYFLAILGFPKQASSYKEISPEIAPFFLRHGPVIRVVGAF